MSLYNEQTTVETRTITTFDRAKLITVDNPNGMPPHITFVEERIQREDGVPDVSLGQVGTLSKEMTAENATTQFDLLNPATGQVIGTAQYQDLQVLLYSLYFHLAMERDNG
jgi:hypothetical protein